MATPEHRPTLPLPPGQPPPQPPVPVVVLPTSFLDTLKGIFTGKARVSSQMIFGAIIAFGGLMQITAVHDYVMPLIANHPHISSAVAALTGLATLLHNPQVVKILHITRETP